MYEKMYFSMDKIVLDIKNRDIQGFSYEGENNNIFVKENQIVFKLNELFYKIEFDKGKLYISDAEDLKKLEQKLDKKGKFQEDKINLEIKKADGYFMNEFGQKEYIFEINIDKIKDYYFPNIDESS